MIADPLGLFDCCGVSDGAARAIVTTPDIARSLGRDNPVTVKAIQLCASNGWEMQYGAWDDASVRRACAWRMRFIASSRVAPARGNAIMFG